MLKAILTTEKGEVLTTRDMIAISSFPPAIYLDGDLYLLLMHKTPTEAFYRATAYYLFPPTPPLKN